MTLTKKLEADVLKAYNDVWHAYLSGDMRTFASILDNNCYIIGSAAGEVFNNKKSAVKYYKSTAEQITGKAEFRNRKINVMPADKGFMVNEESDFYLLIDDQWAFYGAARISSLFHNKKNKWKVIYQHGSFPDSKTEGGERVSTEKIKAENIQLRDAMTKRTIELDEKNRKLEIEAALERVRARAMSMQHSDELADLVATVFKELTALGFALTSSIIWIHDHHNATDTLWIASAKANKPAKPFRIQPFHNSFFRSITQAWKARDQKWTYTLKGQAKKTFEKAFFKELPDLPDALRKALINPKQVAFSASFNNFGALEIVETEALTDEKFDILHRFGKVFDLSYTRFNDLKKAEAQAREAQIEAALERVRSRSMAMHHSNDLQQVIKVVTEQLMLLGFKFNTANFAKVYSDGSWDLWLSTPEQSYPDRIYVPYLDHKIFNQLKDIIAKKLDFFTDVYDKKESNKFFRHFFKNTIAKNAPESRKQFVLNSKGFARSLFLMKDLWLVISNYEGFSYTLEENAVFKRFANVFEQAYIRFLDLQKAEAQTREAEIELALERVRAKTMAMQKPSEFLEVINVIGEQFIHLGFDIEWANFGANGLDISEGIDIWNFAIIPGGDPISARVFIPYFDHLLFNKAVEELNEYRRTGHDFFILAFGKDDKDRWLDHLFTKTVFKDVPGEYRTIQYAKPGYTTSNLALKDTWLSIGKFDITNFTDEQHAILRKFGNAFGQAYTRFLDLQKAEAQAMEARIEAALEKVRSRSLAMHRSDELGEVVAIVFDKLKELNFSVDKGAAIIMIFSEGTKDHIQWIADWYQSYPIPFKIPYSNHSISSDIFDARENGAEFFSKLYSLEEKNDYFNFLFEHSDYKNIPDVIKSAILGSANFGISAAFAKNSALVVPTSTENLLSKDQQEILKRFTKVFEQSYIRFLDLQKAEAQTREAQIEAGLERVRARAMAMQTSEELNVLIGNVFTELTKLDLVLTRCVIWVFDPATSEPRWWMANSEEPSNPMNFLIKYHKHPAYLTFLQEWKKQNVKFVYDLKGQDKISWDDILFNETELVNLPDVVKNGMRAPERVLLSASFNNFGGINVASLEPLSDEHFDILLRFAKVFDLTYTRFNDLKQAEAQAKESRIQLALERVRARTMAMQHSAELQETTLVLFQQFKALGATTAQVSLCIFDEATKMGEMFVTLRGEKIDRSFPMEIEKESFVMKKAKKAFLDKQKNFSATIKGKELQEYNKWRNNLIGKKGWDDSDAVQQQAWHVDAVFFSRGMIGISSDTPATDEAIKLLERFSYVFDLTFTRFLDLKKAEEQTKESQIQLALERVRARTMAMQKSDELSETAAVLFKQFQDLGDDLMQMTIGVMNEEERVFDFNVTDWSGSGLQVDRSFKLSIDEPSLISKFYKAWKEQTLSIVVDLTGKELEDWIRYRNEASGITVSSMDTLGRRVITAAAFSKGVIAYSSPIPRPEESRRLLERFAGVFDLTYTRFLDLKQAEAQAKEAQIEAALERVRSRTMAMHQTSELQEVIHTVHKELLNLNLSIDGGSFVVINEDVGPELRCWGAGGTADTSEEVYVPNFNMPFCTDLINGIKRGTGFFTEEFSQKEKNEYFTQLFKHKPWSELNDEQKKETLSSSGGYTRSVAVSKYTSIFIINHHGRKFTEGENDILRRFAKVFEQTYTRFLDLQKAEAQAREAQIELALERVRARTMAMHRSEELAETAQLLFHQLQELGGIPDRISIGIVDETDGVVNFWTTDQLGSHIDKSVKARLNERIVISKSYQAWKDNKRSMVIDLHGDDVKEWIKFAREEMGVAVKDEFIKDRRAQNLAFFSHGWILVTSHEPQSAETIQILERFASVFNLTYRRFLDLQKAEAQAREAQIEAALERVRSSSLAMHKSEELKDVVKVVFENFRSLGLQNIDSVNINIFHEGSRDFDLWLAAAGQDYTTNFHLPYLDHPIANDFFNAVKKRESIHKAIYDHDLKNKYFEYMFEHSDNKYLPEERKKLILNGHAYSVATGIAKHSSIFIHNYNGEAFSDEANGILVRFSKVFDQAYTRFLDLQKAEAQAREAQIETSLERVRSKTMAMHNSKDVGETVATMFAEFVNLDIHTNRCGILIFDNENSAEVWTAKSNSEGKATLIIGKLDLSVHDLLSSAYRAWNDKRSLHQYVLQGDDIVRYYEAINRSEYYPVKFDLKALPVKEFHNDFFFPEGAVFSFTNDPVAEEHSKIFKRFAGVFGQTYRRYLDLQKAEAQAREAQVEAGLERVRAKTMAMHSSEDVGAATATMFTELERLGIENFRGGITNIHPDRTQDVWSVNNLAEGKAVKAVGRFNMDDHPFWQLMYKEWENKKDFVYTFLSGKEKEDYIKILNANQGYLPQAIQQFPDVHFQVYSFSEGGVWTNSLTPHTEEEKQIMKRFASVFSLTFRRYQDLKKAEAQAKEATIEAALEKVRGKAMAMHNSNDLSITASMVFTELRKLGINSIRCGVGLLTKNSRRVLWYSATAKQQDDLLSLIGESELSGHPEFDKQYESWLNNKNYFTVLRGGDLTSYYAALYSKMSHWAVTDIQNKQEEHGYYFAFSLGFLYSWTDKSYSENEINILNRFKGIIDLTFRRYFELQKSEANAREAVKQAALDRVRADIASMRSVSDLDRITPLIWNELKTLSIPFIRCGVFIMDEDQQLLHTFLSTPDGKAIAAFHLPYDTPGNISKVVANWRHKKIYVDHWGEEEFIQFADILMKQGSLASREQYLKTIPQGGFYLHFLPFLQGMLYVGNTEQLNEEQIELIQHVADAFSTAYARYEDFNKLEAAKQQVENTLTDLKQAQTQLVQSEKMASLGELTAGIAHEIQNPLNFVNNFSEVSKELLDEMKTELETGNTEDAKDIADDVIQNLEKINHHGKRADAIVKSMLQHSRSSSGKKEPTDINGLADEYLRLAYHGLRAKDKSFNAKFETEFDNSIGKVNIISQDMGRVLVNLINNAFYAVSEKKKQESNGYEPTVTVYTKKIDEKIEIKVKDNGNGIPQKVLDKIFQPFFTTKPTGQGTGLGLSLSYDIVKAHGGELKVETKEGEGSEFIIQLNI
ncbi:MAG TPA: ATP-binding protein [Chitinophagaceae bacterium]|nr:ATP-binding protein [Chitinophagaceae bacterium]